MVVSPNDTAAIQGTNVTLNCNVSLLFPYSTQCIPDNCISLNWVYNTTVVSKSSSVQFYFEAVEISNQLELKSITSANNGVYTCQYLELNATNVSMSAVLTASSEFVINFVNFDSRAFWYYHYNAALQIAGGYDQLTVGSELMLNCSLNPPVADSTFQWTDNSGSVVSNSAVLQHRPVTPTLNGTVYTCTVSSGEFMSTGSQSITITVRGGHSIIQL